MMEFASTTMVHMCAIVRRAGKDMIVKKVKSNLHQIIFRHRYVLIDYIHVIHLILLVKIPFDCFRC